MSIIMTLKDNKAPGWDGIGDHGLLISKLRRFGCDALTVEWFSSFLSNRSMSVKCEDGALSEPLFTTSGIPQGSSLGPLLFAIFINDLHTALRHSKHMIYADDTAIFQHHFPSRIHELIADLNSDANAVAAWAAENKLHLNPTKTTVMILGSLAHVSSIDKADLPKITLNGTSIAYSSSIKCLGVTIRPTLLWTKYINSLRSKSHFALYSLRFYRHALNRQLRARLAVALVLPHLDYAAAVYNDISATSDLKLQRLQNAYFYFVFASIPAREHVTPYRLALGWLSVKRRRQYLLVLLALNILRSGEPGSLRHLFKLSSDRQVRHSLRRQAPLLSYKTPRTSSLHNSFFITASQTAVCSEEIKTTNSRPISRAITRVDRARAGVRERAPQLIFPATCPSPRVRPPRTGPKISIFLSHTQVLSCGTTRPPTHDE
ncbi:unnamed protein product [Trichogramma brassicae]|uniref:Reverse transcriptase domain-containing protein n=1 Tax=Trichogramma brassicae TaxID=86971 RepID=A0A6H5HX12_9HYME|nr:unnamed protein product [Trichogramma brassicae]